MKKYLKVLLIPFFMVFLISSCKKDEHKIFLEEGTPPVLNASVTGTIPLAFANKDKEAIRLSWTNPDYKFTTGVSSHDVSYQIEIDTVGANFTNPQKQTISIPNDLSSTLTQGVFNDYLLNQLVLQPGVSHQIEIRVNASLDNNSALLSSNVLQFTVTPYAIPPKVTPPTTSTLFIVGSATPGGSAHGWDNPLSQPTEQMFVTKSPTLYEIIIPLIGGGEYKFIAVNGSWTEQWSIAKADDPTELYGGDFVFNGANILAPPASGTYKIVVDFQRGKFTVTLQ